MISRLEEGTPESQAPRHPPVSSRVAWVGGWTAGIAIALWLSQLLAVWLLVAAAGAAAWSWFARRPVPLAAAAALWIAIGIGLGTQLRITSLTRDWSSLQAEIEGDAAAQLNIALDDVVGRAEEAVDGASSLVRGRTMVPGSAFTRLSDVRESTGIAAIAVLERSGRPVVWAGEHRGTIPREILSSGERYTFHAGPLFSYLYFARPVGDGRTAVAAVLLESDLRPGEGTRPFATRFAAETGLTPRFTSPSQATGASIWDWSTDRPILSVSFEALTQASWWQRVVDRARWFVGAVWLLALALLAVAWYRARMPAPGLPVAMVTIAVLAAPLREMLPAERLFSPVQFVLPLPWDVTLGGLLLFLIGLGLWTLIHTADREPPERFRLPWWAQAVIGAAVFAGVFGVDAVVNSASVGLRAAHPAGGGALQTTTVLAVAIPVYLLLWLGRRQAGRYGVSLIATAFALAVAFGVSLVVFWRPGESIPVWAAAGWGVPFALLAAGMASLPSTRSSVRNWLVAGAFTVTIALPALWVMHVQAKLQTAETELARLGTEADPFLDFLLRTFAERARHFDDEGETGVNLLYRSWVASGLAREGYESRLTTWQGLEVETELRLSGLPEMPSTVTAAVANTRGTDKEVVARFADVEGVHYLLLVPLPGDRMISVAVPPRTQLSRATALARFLESDAEPGAADVVESLYLVPLENTAGEGSDTPAMRRGEVIWLRTGTGWRSEARARFPSGWMHAHLFVRSAPLSLLLVRAILVSTLMIGALACLWLAARLICGGLPPFPYVRTKWLRSFRGRLTIALFAFFLLPTAIFAAAAYQAVSREVVRSAAGVSLRALNQAARNVFSTPLARLGAEVGTDLLVYRNGALANAAAPEVIALGLFDSWLPPQVYLTFRGGEDLEDWEIRRLGANDYVVGYLRFNETSVFASPVPLAQGEIRRRQLEFRDIALLMMLLGGGLSVVLSLLVGSALTRPIEQLSRAAAAIGGGNLAVQLTEERHDEFGTVYRSFNRMARRLGRARTALEQETRRTETIVAEAATGVLALDGDGRLELVNPRAAEILGTSLDSDNTLPRSNALLAAVADAVREFRASNEPEAGREIQMDGRIVRLRLRRLTPSGTVVALEDVTAEIRTTRVLAWGEMARQVAHEIKNPLTPIKLAVQHLRRAYLDGREDYREILDRNVDAILEEIDRLSEIARAFSRFGTPPAAASELESVDVARAVHDSLALYRGAGEGIRFTAAIDGLAGIHAVARLGELKEVLVNLLENARDAVDGGGEVRVEVSTEEPGWVDITVADTGEGIPPDLLPRIFEPQFSTRTSGTGLGLAIVRRLVESWGGEATAESQRGVGTRVRIRLKKDGDAHTVGT